jgi:hypothetical protein
MPDYGLRLPSRIPLIGSAIQPFDLIRPSSDKYFVPFKRQPKIHGASICHIRICRRECTVFGATGPYDGWPAVARERVEGKVLWLPVALPGSHG